MSSSSVQTDTPMTPKEASNLVAVATYRLEESRKRIEQLERALKFREARIDELVHTIHTLRNLLPAKCKEAQPDYKPITIIPLKAGRGL